MERPKQRIELAIRIHNVTAALTIAVLAVLAVISIGCAEEPLRQSTVDEARAGPAVSKAVMPITIEIKPGGDTKVTDANGAAVLKRSLATASPAGGRKYVFGAGRIRNPVPPAETMPAICVREEGKRWRCGPKDRSLFIQLDSRGIQQAYYISNERKSVEAALPVSTPRPIQGRQILFGKPHEDILREDCPCVVYMVIAGGTPVPYCCAC